MGFLEEHLSHKILREIIGLEDILEVFICLVSLERVENLHGWPCLTYTLALQCSFLDGDGSEREYGGWCGTVCDRHMCCTCMMPLLVTCTLSNASLLSFSNSTMNLMLIKWFCSSCPCSQTTNVSSMYLSQSFGTVYRLSVGQPPPDVPCRGCQQLVSEGNQLLPI